MSTEGIKVHIGDSKGIGTSVYGPVLGPDANGKAFTLDLLAKRDEEIARRAFDGIQLKLRAFFGDIWNDMLMGKEAYYFIESEIKDYLNSEDFKKATK